MEKKLEEAEDVQVYLPFGDLLLDFVEDNYDADGGTVAGASPDSDTAVTDYERHLDLDRAVASECYVRNGAKFTRTCFISAPAQGLVYQIKSSRPFSILVHCDGALSVRKIIRKIISRLPESVREEAD